jgi:hypothetical protein
VTVRKKKPAVRAAKKTPHRLFIPNAETVKAMKEARDGKLKTVGDFEGLMADLHSKP